MAYLRLISFWLLLSLVGAILVRCGEPIPFL